jgi:hypothetical protein
MMHSMYSQEIMSVTTWPFEDNEIRVVTEKVDIAQQIETEV